jgi:hypothetical protein
MSEEQQSATAPETNTPPPSSEVPAQQSLQQPLDAIPPNDKPAWAPDWSFKFGEEMRKVDEFFHPLAKDEEALKKVKDFYMRAESSAQNKTKLESYRKQYEPIVQKIGKLQDYYNQGDHDRVMELLGYSDETLFQIAKQKLDRLRMEPQQKEMWEKNRQGTLEKERLMEENEMYRSQATQELARVTGMELDMALDKAEFSSIRDAYDKAYGSGAFRDLVVDRGAYLVAQRGDHIRPSELIPMVAKEFAPFINAMSGMTQASQPETTTIIKPKSIPQVGKGSGSPARGGIRSLDDLRKKAAQLSGE